MLSLIGENPKHIDSTTFTAEFNPSQEEIDIINDFIHWENAEKNKQNVEHVGVQPAYAQDSVLLI